MLFGLAALALLIVLAPITVPYLRRRFGYLVASISFLLFVWFAAHTPELSQDAPRIEVLPWLPTLGSSLAFRLDGLGALFALLITGIGALVALYTVGYLEDHPRLVRFWIVLLLFELAMLAVVLADDILVLFVFWELTGIASFFLIGFASERPRARASAQQALVVTGAGGLALLAGLLLLALQASTFRLSELLVTLQGAKDEPIFTAAFILVLLGAATKSAQVPFHFWLPNAMEAPTPVSAYLHSATMVKAGVYLLARMSPLFGTHPWWEPALVTLGSTTALLGVLLAVPQRDLKRLLAYSTVSALGTLVLLLGLGSAGAKPFALFLLAHALYKGGAFLVTGAIEHATGSRNLDRIGSLWHTSHTLAIATGLVVLAAAGLPPTLSYVAKEAALEAGFHDTSVLVFIVLLFSFTGHAAVAWLLLRPILTRSEQLHDPHGVNWTLLAGPLLLASTALLSGVVVSRLVRLIQAVTASLHTKSEESFELALWHGFTPVLGASSVLLVVAAAIALVWPRILRLGDRLALTTPLEESPRGLGRWGTERWYGATLLVLNRFATLVTGYLQNGYLRVYVSTVILTALALVGASIFHARIPVPADLPAFLVIDVIDAILVGIIVVSSLVAVRAAERLAAVAALGALGFSLALLYARYGAPDLAITQVLVDTLTVVLLVFAFYRLPRYARLSSTRSRVRDAILATAFGCMMAGFALATHVFRYPERISAFFVEEAYPAAHGRNVVNVILVDFRALDTLGEITVLGLAALGVAALLRRRGERTT
ncbi:proton-conducting transporter membrane subunit [Thermomicrobium sp. 4228-Ro]|uniref:hydrogen gas-evolving membrane-bound hydrogenase subunit E n=1 Tax=Thermomicrobium sp. 4228-Ro TaxID=2993937 RepID=UPI002248F343|nr:hydrogen gas-evolving membrane-bound hydrogenase subunit E [Thermomicrobium sp. 4228-Ro]MCX2728358.1 proton-conducting transporter membrane subunit [Thermomicrobium sp. 4228-Ro]